ncbi:MAG: hypothetical protein A3H70_01265 [Candidatus Komeilibacteria bacterium RIFCSPLOWO2_02_FULL_48_11]|uniref:RNA polymerase sigma-70 region 2 domain-containing protein n=1 Tax=Candidatus Komeilibacteria bacterium RIFCSPLOWO2_02_FULL_48_11 TaxID=1798553 RepID=A0A1G2BQT4_9BACT|nr:MAG: hypothetical protein A3H70_01265 [Candidatus Komeilibacteria bacterium RIFCSPLOWO2_02_FULL_48_11]
MRIMAQYHIRAGPASPDFHNFSRYPRGLSRVQEAALVRAAKQGTPKQESHLVVLANSYLQTILLMARQYQLQGLVLEQAMKIGQQAVRQAILTWEKQEKFSEYAVECIQKAFEEFLCHKGRERHDAADG